MHLAGHGQFDARHPYSSGLIVQGSDDPPYAIASNYPGCVRLTIAGILQLLDMASSELVTLSVCSVGRPRLHPASEFTSVPTALLLAGARNVLAAGWPVHDAATAVLMSHFYAGLETAPCPASALAVARRALGRTTREEAVAILERDDVVPPGPRPFASAIFTDAFVHFGIPLAARPPAPVLARAS
jgi:CHAT domain-containing protein